MSNISSKTVSNTKAQPSTEVSVEIIGGKPTTTSLDVAKHFRKRHDNVLRDIKNLECPRILHSSILRSVPAQERTTGQSHTCA